MIISDMQAFAHPGYGGGSSGGTGISVSDAIPATVPMFGVDTTGYAATSIEAGTPNRHEIGGFGDRMFTMLGLMARGRDVGWPWEHARDRARRGRRGGVVRFADPGAQPATTARRLSLREPIVARTAVGS
ncbi:hypothetical protein [Embleya sp. NPDC001921]